MDFKWMAKGGLLLDGSGDLALSDERESMLDMVRSRLKAALNGWKLYPIGADLRERIGDTIDAELETALARQSADALTRGYLPSGTFQVKTLPFGDGGMEVLVYLAGTLLATARVTADTLQVS